MAAALVARLVFWLWFALAIAAGYTRILQRIPAPAVQGILFGLTGLLLLAYFRLGGVRRWVDSLDVRVLVLVHATRFVGVYFIMLYLRGELPRAFAVPGGIGDIIIAAAALLVALWPMTPERRLRAIVVWNVVGLVDILMVLVTATRINLTTPGELRALTHLPLSLLPTFLVPLILATHVILFVRALRR